MVMIKEVSCEFPGRRVDQRGVVGPCLGDNLPQYNHSLVQNARTAKESWHSLRTPFQDSGKYRKVSLLWKLMRLELKDCSSVEKYVDKVLQMREA